MKAVLSIEMEILEPVTVASAADLQQLHPSQISEVSIKLTTGGDGQPTESVTFRAQAEDARVAIRNLVALAQISQPGGTAVRVWYRGRSEEFVI